MSIVTEPALLLFNISAKNYALPELETNPCFCSQPDSPFKPRQLLLWGYNAETRFKSFLIGSQEQILDDAGVPASFFDAPSWIWFTNRLKAVWSNYSDYRWPLTHFPYQVPAGPGRAVWSCCPVVSIAQPVRLRFEGVIRCAALVGETLKARS